jgi:hypothetical protein
MEEITMEILIPFEDSFELSRKMDVSTLKDMFKMPNQKSQITNQNCYSITPCALTEKV